MRALTLLTACLLVSGPAGAQVVPTYFRSADLLGWEPRLSRDGEFVSQGGTPLWRLVWGPSGLTLVVDTRSPADYIRVHGISHDGSVVVGERTSLRNPPRATRWQDPVVEALPLLQPGTGDNRAEAVSDDGSVVVGQDGARAVRWVAGVPMAIPDLPSGRRARTAYGASADGSVVVGEGATPAGSPGWSPEAFRWQDGVTVGLGALPNPYNFVSKAYGVSADGRVVVGSSVSLSGIEAVRWVDGVIEPLGDLPGGPFESEALAVSADGSVVVGYGFRPLRSWGAFVWDSTHGMLDLELLLRHGYGVDTGPSEISAAMAVSGDGQIIAGWQGSAIGDLFVAAIPPSCNDGIDNDSDGLTDFPDDPGCFDADDRFEIATELSCDDARDNDGDGLFDYPDDPGCASPFAGSESPACDDDVDNDGDGAIDWDGGSAGGAPDSRCVGMAWRASETVRACGLGPELPLAFVLIASLRSRWRRRRYLM